jgi:hypothetical protein
MTTLLSETGGILLEFLGNPSRELFDEQAATMACMESWGFYQHQAGPAMGRLLTGRFFEIDVPSREFQVNQDGFTAALYVERRVTDNPEDWEKVDIVDIPDLDNEADEGNLAVAFYGQPPTMRLSWDPALDPWSHLKIWHDPDSNEPGTLDDDLELPIRLLKYMIPRRAVILSLPRLMIKAPNFFTAGLVQNIGKINQEILQGYEQEWDMWRFHGQEEGWSQMEGSMDRFYGGRRSPRIRR